MGNCSCCNAAQPEDNNEGEVYRVDNPTREADHCVNTVVGAAIEGAVAGSSGGFTGAVTDDCVNTVVGAAIEGAVAGSSGGFTGAVTGAVFKGTIAYFTTWIKDRPS